MDSQQAPKSRHQTQTPSRHHDRGSSHGHESPQPRATGHGHTTPARQKKQQNTSNAEQDNGQGLSAVPSLDGTQSSNIEILAGQKRVSSGQPQRSETPSKQAYAGPTFHASPAPSSLPIPKLFSRSVPSSAPSDGLQARLDAESDQGAPSPAFEEATLTPSQQPPREESPLDFFFNAQRLEKARESNNGSPQVSSTAGSRQSPQPSRPASTPLNDFQRTRSYDTKSPNFPGREALKMESEPAMTQHRVIDTSDMVSFQDRMRALQSNSAPAHESQYDGFDEQQRQSKTAELKRMLLFHAPQVYASKLPTDSSSENFAQSGQDSSSNSPPTHPTNVAAPLRNSQPRSENSRAPPSSPRRNGRHSQRPSSLHQRTAVINASRAAGEPAAHSAAVSQPSLGLGQNSPKQGQVPSTTTMPNKSPAPLSTSTTPGAPTSDGGNQPSVKSMEDDLRRILKMNPDGGPNV